DQREHESSHATFCASERSGKISKASFRRAEADDHDCDNHQDFERCKEELKITGLLDAEIVQKRDEDGSNHGKQLRVCDREWVAPCVSREEGKCLERA